MIPKRVLGDWLESTSEANASDQGLKETDASGASEVNHRTGSDRCRKCDSHIHDGKDIESMLEVATSGIVEVVVSFYNEGGFAVLGVLPDMMFSSGHVATQGLASIVSDGQCFEELLQHNYDFSRWLHDVRGELLHRSNYVATLEHETPAEFMKQELVGLKRNCNMKLTICI